MTTYEPMDGSIVHIEFYSDDPDATQSFYETMFDWEFDWEFDYDEELDYRQWRAPDAPSGGIVDTDDAPFPAPLTVCYLGTDDLAATAAAVEDAGGELLVEEMEVPEMGAFVVFRAPGDVVAAAWENRSATEPDEPMVFTDEPSDGSVVHFELYSTDTEGTQAFFESAFDWSFETMPDGEYTMAYPPTPPYGGVMAATDEWPPSVLLYVGVPSTDDATDAIEDAGGQTLEEPFDVEGWGRMAVIEAPGGVVTAVWESTEAEHASDAVEDAPAP